MSKSTVLLEHHFKALKLPTMLREYGKAGLAPAIWLAILALGEVSVRGRPWERT